MNGLFIEFRDPLFGIILFFAIVFIISSISYWMKKMRSRDDAKHIERFLDSFSNSPSQQELKEAIDSSSLKDEFWLLIAKAYVSEGDFEKAIQIYQNLSKRKDDPQSKRETLLLLAQTYLKAGFLERSKKILFEILETKARSQGALRLLLFNLEKMRDYDKALEVLDALEELGESVDLEKIHIKTMQIIDNKRADVEQKSTALVKLCKSNGSFTYKAMQYLFANTPALAWDSLDLKYAPNIADILWSIPEESLRSDIISSDDYLRELFSARGCMDFAKSSQVFELDALIKLRRCGTSSVSLQFEYICNNCKSLGFFAASRCAECHSIDSITPKPLLTQGKHETSNTF